MATTLLRFNCVQPGLEPNEMHQRYHAMLDMAQALDELGGCMITLEEHHGAVNGWSPSPLIMAGAIFGRTKTIAISISALLVPLHDPLRIAEDIAVLDLISGGKLTVIGGIGYRPEEYAAHGKDWADRGKLMDECVDTLLKAWTAEPFEYNGTDGAGHPEVRSPSPTRCSCSAARPSRLPAAPPASACRSCSPPRCPRSRPTTTRSAPSTARRASP